MTNKYPLKDLVLIKEKRLNEAERHLKECKLALEKEEKVLKDLEEDRDKTKLEKQVKLDQFREKLDEGTTSDKIQVMKQYLKMIEDELKKRNKKVELQKKKVVEKEKLVEKARKDRLQKQNDLEKMHLHHKEWKAEALKEEKQVESTESDEMGSVRHHLKKRKPK